MRLCVHRGGYGFLAIVALLLASCARQPQVIVLLPTATLQGPVVPTRAPTNTLALTATAETTIGVSSTNTVEVTETAISSTTSASSATSTRVLTAVAQLATATVEISPSPTESDSPVLPTLSPTSAPPTATSTNASTPSPQPTATNQPSATSTDTPLPSPTQITPSPTALPSSTPTPLPPSPTRTVASSATPQPTLLPTSGLAVPYLDSTSFWPVTLSEPITLGVSLTSSITDDAYARLYPYEGKAGEVLNLSTISDTDELWPLMLVIDPKGRELVRSQDNDSVDATIRGLRLAEDGTHIVVVTRPGGIFGINLGTFTLAVEVGSSDEAQEGLFTRQVAYNSTLEDTIDDDTPLRMYTFRGAQGDHIQIQMLATTGDLDTVATLTDNLGIPLITSDDDFYNQTINSFVNDYILPTDGYFSILAQRFSSTGTTGDYTLTLSLLEGSDEPGTRLLEAPLNPLNSISLRTDAQIYVNFTAGDMIDEAKQELRVQTLLTFGLPPAEGAVAHATFDLSPCYEAGSGFDALGELTIYEDRYGSLLQTRDFIRTTAGARILAAPEQCEPIDVTDLITELYAAGADQVQFRLSFRNSPNNDDGDQVSFTPRLFLAFAE